MGAQWSGTRVCKTPTAATAKINKLGETWFTERYFGAAAPTPRGATNRPGTRDVKTFESIFTLASLVRYESKLG